MMTEISFEKNITHTVGKPWLIEKWMKWFGYRGLATPWNTIYYRDSGSFMDGRLRKHEVKHICQMYRDGKFMFLLKYNWYWLTKGYKNNPYEIEAKEAESE